MAEITTPLSGTIPEEGSLRQLEDSPLSRPPPLKPRADDTALDYGITESLLEGQTKSLDVRTENNAQGVGAFDQPTGTVEDTVIGMLRTQLGAGIIKDDIGLDLLDAADDEKKKLIIENALKKADFMEMSQLNMAAVAIYMADGGELPEGTIKDEAQGLTIAEWQEWREGYRSTYRDENQRQVDEFIASQGIENYGLAVVDAAAQELIPIYNIASKNFLLQRWQDILKMPHKDTSEVWLGSMRKEIATWLVNLSDSERVDAVGELIAETRKLQADPLWGKYLRQFGVYENFEMLLTPDVIRGKMGNTAMNFWIGQLETAAEAIWGAWILKTGIKSYRSGGWRAVFSSPNQASTAARVARETRARRAQTKINKAIRGKVAEHQGVDPTALDTALDAPKNKEFVDTREVHLPGVVEASERAERVASRMHQNADRSLFHVLGEEGRANTASKLMANLQLGDNAVVVPSMSIVEELDNGIRVQQVIAKSGEEGWRTFDELVPDLLLIDPRLENVKIMQVMDDGLLHYIPMDAEMFAKVATGTSDIKFAGQGEFFLEFDQFRQYHPMDKMLLGDAAGIRSTWVPKWFLTPNVRQSDDIYGATRLSHHRTAVQNRLTDTMFTPFYNLGTADKKQVANMYEWSEHFGKETGKSPTLTDFYAEFPNMTPKQAAGLVALRKGYDTLYELADRRVWEDFAGQQFKTARPLDPELPRYHGKVLDRAEVKLGRMVIDPVTKKGKRLTAVEVEAAYNGGGGIMKVDVPIDVEGTKGLVKTTYVLMDGDAYTVGRLSDHPLEFYPGFRYRMYENPYFVNKVTRNATIDGVKQVNPIDDAFKTAGSAREAESFLGRIANKVEVSPGVWRWIDKKDGVTEYNFTLAKDMDQQDFVLAQKQSFQKEGRFQYDQRERDALPDVNGNVTPLTDFVVALERGSRLANKVNSEEDTMRAIKNAFNEEYSQGPHRLINDQDIKNKGIRQVVDDLKTVRNNTVDKDALKRVNLAIERAKYIRMMDGFDSAVIPFFKKRMLDTATALDRFVSGNNFKWVKATKFGRGVERFAQTMSPVAAATKIPFKLFLAWRPLRQRLLQSVQPLMYSGLDPVYFLSGRGFINAHYLKVGFMKLTNSAFSDMGYSRKFLQKTLGMSDEEYKVVLDNLEKSGIVDIVDAHAFSGGSKSFQRMALPKDDAGLTSRAVHGSRAVGNRVDNFLTNKGFNSGEQTNKLVSWDYQMRLLKKRKGYSKFTDLTDDDWRKVAENADNMALAMTKPNAGGYSQGATRVMTQFLSFTHKLSLTMLGQNPALNKVEVLRLWIGAGTLFGANSVGMRDEASELMFNQGFDKWIDAAVPGTHGATVVEFISAGLLQTITNKVFKSLGKDSPNMENVTPIAQYKQLWEMHFDHNLKNPLAIIAATATGAFGSRVSAAVDAAQFITLSGYAGTFDDDPVASLTSMADMATRRLLPQYDDIASTWMAYETGKLYRASGEHISFTPDNMGLLLRTAFGIRTMEEAAAWRLHDRIYDSDATVASMIKAHRKLITQQLNLYYRDGAITKEDMVAVFRMTANLASRAPDGRMQEVIEGTMLGYFDEDKPQDMPFAQLVKAAINGQVDKGVMLSLADILPGATPEEREQFKAFVEEVIDDRVLSEEEMRQLILEDTKRRD